jgi:hypothetical protein
MWDDKGELLKYINLLISKLIVFVVIGLGMNSLSTCKCDNEKRRLGNKIHILVKNKTTSLFIFLSKGSQ